MTFEDLSEQLIKQHPEVVKSQMFGMPCLKLNKKVLAGFHSGEAVFKLGSAAVPDALKIPGAKLFDPGMGRPMKDWVQVPTDQSAKWPELAESAFRNLATK